jgi:hypothetical protein
MPNPWVSLRHERERTIGKRAGEEEKKTTNSCKWSRFSLSVSNFIALAP